MAGLGSQGRSVGDGAGDFGFLWLSREERSCLAFSFLSRFCLYVKQNFGDKNQILYPHPPPTVETWELGGSWGAPRVSVVAGSGGLRLGTHSSRASWFFLLGPPWRFPRWFLGLYNPCLLQAGAVGMPGSRGCLNSKERWVSARCLPGMCTDAAGLMCAGLDRCDRKR